VSDLAGGVPSGLVPLHKPPGLTSFEALGAVKRALGTGKVGHTGTLDKFAEGLLLVLTGRALKLSPWFSHCDKQYRARIHFGIETDTLDPEGAETACAPPPSRETLLQILPQFTGVLMQEPPVYSAIHVDGKRASARARAGEAPVMQKRAVHLYSVELLSWEPPFANISVHCSGGTYIRSLARDIARAAGSRAHLSALVRTHVAGFALTDAARAGSDCPAPRPIDTGVISALGLPYFELDPPDAAHIIHGKPLAPLLAGRKPRPPAHTLPAAPPGTSSAAAGVFCGGAFIAMLAADGDGWKYGYVYARH
jgi:tRNA pseudouridine55 synthase